MDYNDLKKQFNRQDKQESIPKVQKIQENFTEIPAIPLQIIEWLRSVFPLRRYDPFDQPIYQITLDKGRDEVINRLQLEYERQHMEK